MKSSSTSQKYSLPLDDRNHDIHYTGIRKSVLSDFEIYLTELKSVIVRTRKANEETRIGLPGVIGVRACRDIVHYTTIMISM